MSTELGPALRAKRESAGMTMREAAAALQIGHGYLSQLETGKITWPNADIRRRLANWLGVSHVALMVLLGELREDEVTTAGAEDVPPDRAQSPAAELYGLLDKVNWYGRPDRVQYMRGLIEAMIDVDRQYKEIV